MNDFKRVTCRVSELGHETSVALVSIAGAIFSIGSGCRTCTAIADLSQVAVAVVLQEVDTADPTGRMIAGMRGVVSQWEREIIGKRTKEALAEKKAQGIKLGRPRLEDREAMHRVVELRMAGESVRSIARAMYAEGFRTPNGGGWHPTTVARALANRKDPSQA